MMIGSYCVDNQTCKASSTQLIAQNVAVNYDMMGLLMDKNSELNLIGKYISSIFALFRGSESDKVCFRQEKFK